MKNLKILKPIFLKLIEKNIKFRFKLIGSANNLKLLSFFNSIKNLNFIYKNHIKWENINSSISELKTFDIGIMPLIKDQKTLGKCAFKIVEYMAAGIPVIASPIGENKIIIENNINGFLAKDNNDWFKKIMFLKNNKKVRNRFIRNAEKKVKYKYSNKSNVLKMRKILNF